MKKQIIIAALALGVFALGTNNVNAQNHTATTAANIILVDVISIDGGVAIGGGVDFNFDTAEKYNTGLTVNVPNSLKVTSTKNFDIKVKADGANFTDGTNDIPVGVMTIQVAEGGTMGGEPTTIVLTTTDQFLVSGADLGSSLTLDLDYIIPAAKSSSSDILGKPAGTYTQNVTYTATAL